MSPLEVPTVDISNLFTKSANQLTVSVDLLIHVCRRYGNSNFIIKCYFCI